MQTVHVLLLYTYIIIRQLMNVMYNSPLQKNEFNTLSLERVQISANNTFRNGFCIEPCCCKMHKCITATNVDAPLISLDIDVLVNSRSMHVRMFILSLSFFQFPPLIDYSSFYIQIYIMYIINSFFYYNMQKFNLLLHFITIESYTYYI